jgi:hypothetical protein
MKDIWLSFSGIAFILFYFMQELSLLKNVTEYTSSMSEKWARIWRSMISRVNEIILCVNSRETDHKGTTHDYDSTNEWTNYTTPNPNRYRTNHQLINII